MKVPEILVAASVPSSLLESEWTAIEEESQEMLMFGAESTDPALDDKYL